MLSSMIESSTTDRTTTYIFVLESRFLLSQFINTLISLVFLFQIITTIILFSCSDVARMQFVLTLFYFYFLFTIVVISTLKSTPAYFAFIWQFNSLDIAKYRYTMWPDLVQYLEPAEQEIELEFRGNDPKLERASRKCETIRKRILEAQANPDLTPTEPHNIVSAQKEWQACDDFVTAQQTQCVGPWIDQLDR